MLVSEAGTVITAGFKQYTVNWDRRRTAAPHHNRMRRAKAVRCFHLMSQLTFLFLIIPFMVFHLKSYKGKTNMDGDQDENRK
jgi:hypothetical protein